jgi:alpha-beta hydrolase superfamily lysophospholipase
VSYGAICLLAAHVLTRPNNAPVRERLELFGDDLEAWSTRTADGLTLRGWYGPTAEKRRLIVLVHGMGASRDEMVGLGHDLYERGYDILMFDLRGHGASDPARLSMGRREREDLRAVQAWAGSQGFTPDRVGWMAFSMGAATVLMEAERNRDIRAAVLDSPFGNLPELLNLQLSQHSHLPSFFNPGILLAARWAFGIRTDDLIPLRSAAAWAPRPMLLIHGEADTTVPVHQARQIAEVVGPSCRKALLPGVGHVGAYERNPEHYVQAVDGFFSRALSP